MKMPAGSKASVERDPNGELETASMNEPVSRSLLFRSCEAVPPLDHHDRVSAPEGRSSHEGSRKRPPTRMGRYLVIGELGRGGMGVVLRAYDPKLQREVALKRLRSPRVSAELVARMVREAQAMAKLNHEHVVSVHDLDLIGDDVLLAMEYVDGCDLRRWLEDTRPAPEILEIFAQAGRGLQAAHEAGLLHRDFKPANVLVTRAGIAKVTDFGLARLESAYSTGDQQESSSDASPEVLGDSVNLLGSGVLTAAGTVMGTPAYMAPEQHREGPLSPAADQYAFCVSLWQALTGRLPFANRGQDALLSSKLAGPPAWPKPTPNLPKPVLAAIVRGLSPNPQHRWPSMAHLLAALAYDPQTRRNRAYAVAGTIGAVTLGAGGLHAWAAARAERCSGAGRQLEAVWGPVQKRNVEDAISGVDVSYAAGAWNRAEPVLDEFARQWRSSYTEACEATARREQSTEVMDLRMACLQRAKVDLQAAIGVLLQADAEIVQNAEKVTGDLPDLRACADLERLQADRERPAEEDEAAVNKAQLQLAQASAFDKAGKYEAAAKALEEARAVLDQVDYGPVMVQFAALHADNLCDRGDYEASEKAWREAMTLAIAHGDRRAVFRAADGLIYVLGAQLRRFDAALEHRAVLEGALGQDPVDQAIWRTTLGVISNANGRYEEAEAESRAALELRIKDLGPDHLAVAASHNNLGIALNYRGKFEAAEAEFRTALALWTDVLGADHPHVAAARNNLAMAFSGQGRFEEAEAEYRVNLEVRSKALGPDHPDVAMSRNNLATVLSEQGRYEEAEAEYRVVLEHQKKALSPEHPDVAGTRYNLGITLVEQGRYEEAEVELSRALDLRMQLLRSDHPDTAASHQALGNALLGQGELDAAGVQHRAALELFTKALGADHPDVARARIDAAEVLAATGRYESAEVELRAAVESFEKALGPDHPLLASSRSDLAGILLELGRPVEALELAEHAWLTLQGDEIEPRRQAEAAFVLGRALVATHTSREAQLRAARLVQRAQQIYRELGTTDTQQLAQVEGWLRSHHFDDVSYVSGPEP